VTLAEIQALEATAEECLARALSELALAAREGRSTRFGRSWVTAARDAFKKAASARRARDPHGRRSRARSTRRSIPGD
jgi:hypothetical protein